MILFNGVLQLCRSSMIVFHIALVHLWLYSIGSSMTVFHWFIYDCISLVHLWLYPIGSSMTVFHWSTSLAACMDRSDGLGSVGLCSSLQAVAQLQHPAYVCSSVLCAFLERFSDGYHSQIAGQNGKRRGCLSRITEPACNKKKSNNC